MHVTTQLNLNGPLWPMAQRLYHRSFAAEGRKSDAIIAAMFAKGMCRLHVATEGDGPGGEAVAMAITGLSGDGKALLIDYLAVAPEWRGQGIGEAFVRFIAAWAKAETSAEGIVIEAESEPLPDNERRIRFWQKCGFALTDYVHRYVWVPERYRAMYLAFAGSDDFPRRGEQLFDYITAFHRKAYAR